MLIVGLDAAADLANFGYAIARLEADVMHRVEAGLLGSESRISSLAARHLQTATQVLLSIDAPLGWPRPLSRAISAHRAGQSIPDHPNQLFRRATDLYIKRTTGKQPLDIGADRIARAAWSALNVLGIFRRELAHPIPMVWEPDFDGRFGVIEVYPAATLAGWGLRSDGYKKNEQIEARRTIAQFFNGRAPWLSELVNDSVDVFDAGLCAIAGSDFLAGRAAGPTDRELAEHESWIWVRSSR